jgi:Spy/CpxP family protein refolding chaperone
MKLKLKSIVAGVIATAAIAATPLIAFAQAQAPAQAPAPATAPATENKPRPRIVLSAEQQAEFEKIQNDTLTQIEGVLTPEQKTQFAAGRESGQGFGAIQNLTDPQKSQIRKILETFNGRIGAMLTPEQKQQIQQSQSNQQ